LGWLGAAALQVQEIGTLPHWDLSNVYPALESEQFKADVAKLRTQLQDIEKYLTANHVRRPVDPKASWDTGKLTGVVEQYVDRMNSSLRLYATLSAYVASFVSTDSYNTLAKRLESELEIVGVELQKRDIQFQGWLGAFTARLPEIFNAGKVAKAHEFYLRETAEQSRYMMSDQEEALAAELELSGRNAWSKLQGTVCSQLTVDFELDGKVQRLPITALQNLNHHPDGEVRRRAYEAELKAWESVREPLAAALNGVKGATITLDKKRGRTDSLHASLDASRIDRETLETLLGVMRNSFPMFRRYLKAKAKRLGKDKLPWWDIFAPLGKSERRYTWIDTQSFIINQFGTFSGRLSKLAAKAFESRWIDAEPRNGKRGGAFCMNVPGVNESRILCNFDGSFDEVSTVAHELGHAYHNECHVGKTMLQTRTPMTLAETASTFCQTIITEAALEKSSSPEEQLGILENWLIDANQVIVDITSRFMFEKEVFDRRAGAELSADDFCEIMLRCQRETYGDGLDPDWLHKYMWAWKVHYYIPGLSFYNYPYAFGLLFALGLYSLRKQWGTSFVKEYESLLASTGEARPAELAARFGIDIRKPKFWEDSLKIVGEQIDRYMKL